MIALISFLVLIAVFLTAARVASVVLEVTGMDRQAAEFQARSALLGVGFTTFESEDITNHPVRRRLVLWLMTFGNAGVITGIGSFIIAFGDAPALQTLRRSGELLAGTVLLLISVHIPAANRLIARVTRAFLRRFTDLEISNLTILLPAGGRWVVAELRVERDSGLTGRSLTNLDLARHDITDPAPRRHLPRVSGRGHRAGDRRHPDALRPRRPAHRPGPGHHIPGRTPQFRSMITAGAMPPAAHIVTRP